MRWVFLKKPRPVWVITSDPSFRFSYLFAVELLLFLHQIKNAQYEFLSNVTSDIQSQINSKQAAITGSATTITSGNLTANRVVISNSSQKMAVSAVTDTELG